MNSKDNNRNNAEPDIVSVEIQTNDGTGRSFTLTNDGITTVQTEDGVDTTPATMQTRAAFRGYIGALTALMGWSIKDAWGTSGAGRADYADSELKY